MTATQWMTEPLRKYVHFDGRAGCAEFWWFSLFYGLVSFAAFIVDGFLLSEGLIARTLVIVLMTVPIVAVSFRQRHDIDRSAALLLLLLWFVPFIGALVVLVWFVQRGTDSENRFGPDPLAKEG